jgi:hypothetical protein
MVKTASLRKDSSCTIQLFSKEELSQDLIEKIKRTEDLPSILTKKALEINLIFSGTKKAR